MDIAYNKVDQTALPIDTTRVSASEYNQIAGSLMNIITSAGLTPDSADNTQLLNALKVIGSGWAMPGTTYDDITIGASGATYTASHDGWLFLKYNVNSTAIGYVSVTQNGHTDQQVYIGAAYTDVYIFTPIKAGNYEITYSNLTFLQANLFHLSGQE